MTQWARYGLRIDRSNEVPGQDEYPVMRRQETLGHVIRTGDDTWTIISPDNLQCDVEGGTQDAWKSVLRVFREVS